MPDKIAGRYQVRGLLGRGGFGAVYEAYDAILKSNGLVDFADLVMKPVLLMRDDPEVLGQLQARHREILVDEYQDVNRASSTMLQLLWGESNRIWVVGDARQSIYRFRRADILLYQRVKEHLVAQGASVVYLSTSFRSTPGIQAAVNGAFAVRGVPDDYERWAAAAGDEWSWPHMLRVLCRLESDQDFANDHHGTSGPVPIVTKRAVNSSPRFVRTIHREVPSSHTTSTTCVWNRASSYRPNCLAMRNCPSAAAAGPSTAHAIASPPMRTPACRRENGLRRLSVMGSSVVAVFGTRGRGSRAATREVVPSVHEEVNKMFFLKNEPCKVNPAPQRPTEEKIFVPR